jgi:FkbM family methyltransferase
MNILDRLSLLKHRLKDSFENEGQKSYSQFGEDIIIATIFYLLKKKSITYLDIGANFPKHFSNTFYFYKKGNKGICIEPDIELFNYYRKIRPRDTVYNIGVGMNDIDEEKEFYFYKDERKGLNTFSQERVLENETTNPVKAEKTSVTLRNINKIIRENFKAPPDLLSIDIEGLDFDVLKTLDFSCNAPLVVCCELTILAEGNHVIEHTALKDLLLSNGYFQYANTFINGIFVHNTCEAAVRKINNWY